MQLSVGGDVAVVAPTAVPSLVYDYKSAAPLIAGRGGVTLTGTVASARSYFDSTGTLQSQGVNVFTPEYDPTTLAPIGIGLFEARTNSIRNNTMVGASSGVISTNWITPSGLGLTVTISAPSAINGISYQDIRFSGTTSGSGGLYIYNEQTTGVPASNGQTWTYSPYIAIVGGSLTNVVQIRNGLNWRQAAGANIAQSTGVDYKASLTSTLQRFSTTLTSAEALTQFVIPLVQIVITGAVAIDITLRIGMPQLELGASASPVVPTSTVAVTRAAPVLSTTDLSWFNPLEGTFVVEGVSTVDGQSGVTQIIYQIDNGSDSYRMVEFIELTSGVVRSRIQDSATVNDAVGATYSDGAGTKSFANSYAASGSSIASDGVLGTPPAAVTLPSQASTVFRIGNSFAGNRNFNGWIKRLTYYPKRLSDAQIQRLST